MNGYICFYKGKRLEVYANSSYEAQTKAAQQFKAKKQYQVDVGRLTDNFSISGLIWPTVPAN